MAVQLSLGILDRRKSERRDDRGIGAKVDDRTIDAAEVRSQFQIQPLDIDPERRPGSDPAPRRSAG
jgi:hypothetical protein